MAWARVQGNINFDSSGTPVGTFAVTLAGTVTSGNAICGSVAWDNNGPTLTSVTDDKSNTYNLETTVLDSTNNQKMAAFSRTNITNGPITFTATFSANTQFLSIVAEEFSGGSTASTDERDGTAHGGQFQLSPGTGTDGITSGNFTTSTNGDLIYGASAQTSTGTPNATHGTNFTDGINNAVGGELIQTEYRTQATAGGSTAATFTQGANASHITFMVALKPAAGGGDTLSGGTTLRFM